MNSEGGGVFDGSGTDGGRVEFTMDVPPAGDGSVDACMQVGKFAREATRKVKHRCKKC